MGDPGDFSSNGAVGFSFRVGIFRLFGDITFIFPAEGIFRLTDGRGGSQPINITQPSITSLAQPTTTLLLTDLGGAEIETAKREVLPAIGKAAQVVTPGQDREAYNRADSWNGA